MENMAPELQAVLDDIELDTDLYGRPSAQSLSALAQLLGGPGRRAEPGSYATRHHRETGHALRFGCCSSSAAAAG